MNNPVSPQPVRTPVVLMEDSFWELSEAIAACLLESGYWVVRAQSADEARLTVERFGARVIVTADSSFPGGGLDALLRPSEARPKPPQIVRIPEAEMGQLLETIGRAQAA